MMEFFDYSGLFDKSWLLFILIAAAARVFGKNRIFKMIGLPFITGYMIIGFVCGPYVLELISVDQVQKLSHVNKIALSFISFSAGAEIHIPEVKPLLKQVLYVSFGMIFFTLTLGSAVVYLLGSTPLLGWLDNESGGCSIAIAVTAASILSARSPTSVLAVIREMHASGPVSALIIAITVGGDVIVLTVFAICKSMTVTLCSGDSFNADEIFIEITLIIASFIWGAILGLGMIYAMRFKFTKHLILPLGFIIFLLCDYIAEVAHETSAYEIHFDALLICISVGFVVANYGDERDLLITYLKKNSKYVFIPFFAYIGVKINLPVLIQACAFAVVACLVRAMCMAIGTITGGRAAGLNFKVSSMLWTGLIPQAGVSLGLTGIIQDAFPATFGEKFNAAMIAVILINQIIGPFGVKYLVEFVDEADKGNGKVAEHPWLSDEDKTLTSSETQTLDSEFKIARIAAPDMKLVPGNKIALAVHELKTSRKYRINSWDSDNSNPASDCTPLVLLNVSVIVDENGEQRTRGITEDFSGNPVSRWRSISHLTNMSAFSSRYTSRDNSVRGENDEKSDTEGLELSNSLAPGDIEIQLKDFETQKEINQTATHLSVTHYQDCSEERSSPI